MQGFYYNETNSSNLYDDISILLSDNIIDFAIAEGWLEDMYVSDKYNTTKMVEKYIADITLNKISESNLDKKCIEVNIEKYYNMMPSLSTSNNNLTSKLKMLDTIRKEPMTESMFVEILKRFDIYETFEYIKEEYINGKCKPDFRMPDPTIRSILVIFESLKRLIETKNPSSPEFKCIKDNLGKILYNYKDFYKDNLIALSGRQGINVFEVDRMTCDDIEVMFEKLDGIMRSLSDRFIKYTVSKLTHLNKMIEYIDKKNEVVTESVSVDSYTEAINLFDMLVESIFFDESDEDIDLNNLIRLHTLTESICEYESTMEASSRIITKGTEKVTKGIGTVSAKSSGMSSSQSKTGQLKRGAKIVDDRASAAINKKLDDIMNVTRDAKREKIITGKNTVKLGKALRSAVTLVATHAGAKVVMGPVMGTITTILGLLTRHALSKRTGHREKKRILLELETELKIVKEKIEDSKGDNAREQKYQLMRIQANLEKEITRIKHGLRYY